MVNGLHCRAGPGSGGTLSLCWDDSRHVCVYDIFHLLFNPSELSLALFLGCTRASFSSTRNRVEECWPCCLSRLLWLGHDELSPGGVVCGSAENCAEWAVSIPGVASRSTLQSPIRIPPLPPIEQTKGKPRGQENLKTTVPVILTRGK